MYSNKYHPRKSPKSPEKVKTCLILKKLNSPRVKIVNSHQREKLKDILISKFKQKYRIKESNIMENEVNNFIQGEKLSDKDILKLDKKIEKMFESQRRERHNKASLSNSLSKSKKNLNKSQPEIFPKIQEAKSPHKTINITNQNNNVQITNPIFPNDSNNDKMGIDLKRITNKRLRKSSSIGIPEIPRQRNTRYRSPAEELAELEAEFTLEIEEEKKRKLKKNFDRIDFSSAGNEWNVIVAYNKKLYENELKKEKEKDFEMKKRIKEDLDNQVKQKIRREIEEQIKEVEGEKMMQEHFRRIDEVEKEKQEEYKKQIILEKISRDRQVKDEYIKKRIDFLTQRKYEKNLIKKVQEELEKEKQEALQEKKMAKEYLRREMQEKELNRERQKELLQKKIEEDIESYKEMDKVALKKELERKRLFEKIRKRGNRYDDNELSRIKMRIKQQQKEEEEQINKYMQEKYRLEEEKERQEKIKKNQEKINLKKFYDKQIEEKKKEMVLEKALDNEQGRIWDLDYKKYKDDEKKMNDLMKKIYKRNIDTLRLQIKNKREKDYQSMSFNEYAMNRELLEKAKIEMDAGNI